MVPPHGAPQMGASAAEYGYLVNAGFYQYGDGLVALIDTVLNRESNINRTHTIRREIVHIPYANPLFR